MTNDYSMAAHFAFCSAQSQPIKKQKEPPAHAPSQPTDWRYIDSLDNDG